MTSDGRPAKRPHVQSDSYSTTDSLVRSEDPEHPVSSHDLTISVVLTDQFSDLIYLAPSGVQKERIKPEDLFVVTPAQEVVRAPPTATGWKMSQCTPLFFNAYNARGAGACIHTHSQNAVMATLLWPGDIFTITHQEMIKGIRIGSTKESLKYYNTLVVPIIENTAEEEDLKDRMRESMTECYDYLFEIAVKMKSLGMDPGHVPSDSEYRHLC
ncbi:hypothetical protein HK101_004227 [Irineochytrium annulatum]|nr:hypothetical protein HK101_004227 [Irineochytrium annulatum]